MTFLNIHGSRLSILPSCITDVRCFVGCSIQFPGEDDQHGEKSYTLLQMLDQVPNFSSFPSMVTKNFDA
jgi:hypothetical protein